jgi:hypothetical protein
VAVDIQTQITIDRPVDVVAGYVADPSNAPAWYVKIESVEWETPPAVQGPFPMETTYTWFATGEGTTRMTLRNRGEPAGFSKVTAPLMATAMRRANRKDLAKLRSILEAT